MDDQKASSNHWILDLILYVIAGALILVALGISAVRYYPNVSDIVEREIEVRLAEVIDSNITIESLDVNRQHNTPRIIAQNVVITDKKDASQSWQIKRILLGISLLDSLLSRSLHFSEIIVEGVDIDIQRDIDGNIRINKTFLLPTAMMEDKDSRKSSQDFSNVRVHLMDSMLRWRDQMTEYDYLFDGLDVFIDATSSGHVLYLSGNLPETVGGTLQAHVDVEGDINNISESNISFHIDADELLIAELAQRHLDIDYELPAKTSSFEVWGQFNELSLHSLTGNALFDDFVEAKSAVDKNLCLSDERIQSLAFQFSLLRDNEQWLLKANDIDVASTSKNWLPAEVHLDLHNKQLTRFAGQFDEIDSGMLCNALHAYAPPTPQLEELLKQYRVHTQLNDVRIDYQNALNTSLPETNQAKPQPSMRYSGDIKNAELHILNSGQKVKSVSGKFSGNNVAGELSLNSQNTQFLLPALFPNQVLSFDINGDVAWELANDSIFVNADELRIANQELTINTRWHNVISDGEIYVDAQFDLPGMKANLLPKYFPSHIRVIRTKNWLTHAARKGDLKDGTILLRGKLRDFPFHKKAGVFEANFIVENGLLEYKVGWPMMHDVTADITINKDRVDINARTAKMFDSEFKEIDVYVESFLRAVLYADGTVDGPGQDLLRFLDEAGLVKGDKSIIDQIALAGDTRLALDFSRSISRKVEHPFQVQGDIHFRGNSLEIFPVDLTLHEMAGQVAFDSSGANSTGVNASLYNHPIVLTSKSAGEGASDINFVGPFDLNQYLQEKYPKFTELVDGTPNVNGTFRLPSMFKSNNPEKISLSVESDLVGVQVNLPEPLNKDAQKSLSSSLLYKQKDKSMLWQFGETLSLFFTQQANQPYVLNQATVGEVIDLKSEHDELLFTGSVDKLPVDDWLSVYNKHIAKESSSDTEKNNPLPTIDLQIGELIWPVWPAQELTLNAVVNDDVYDIDIDAQQGVGSIKVPLNKDLPVSMNMKKLVLNKGAKKSNLDIDPLQIRPFYFTSKELIINELKFKNTLLNTSHDERGLLFDKIQFEAQDLTVNGFGSWFSLDDQQQSFFSLDLVSIDIEDSLEDIGFNSSLRRGDADLTIVMRWQGAPHQFSIDTAEGNATLDIRDGIISEVEPGAGRLLALLNLGAISRRLSLDFSDVTKEGFSFDTIDGELNLSKGGVLYANNVNVKAPSADIEIAGKTNLKSKTYDQNIIVTPKVSGTLPAAGAIVGGPVGAAAGILADQVAKVVGLNKITLLEYKMTGTWEEPKIERVKPSIKKKTSSQPSQPSGSQSPLKQTK